MILEVESKYGDRILLNVGNADAIIEQEEGFCVAHFGTKPVGFKYDFETLTKEMEVKNRKCSHRAVEIKKGRASPQDPLGTRDSFKCMDCGLEGVRDDLSN